MKKQYAKKKKISILLIEDNPDDIFFTKTAFARSTLPHELFVAEDGERALAFLNKTDEFVNMPTPDLVLLDLNLPRKTGLEILREMRSSEQLNIVPVIVLSTSESQADIAESYRLHAHSYIIKPIMIERFSEIIELLIAYWFGVVTLPSLAKG